MRKSYIVLSLVLIAAIGFAISSFLFPSLNALVNWGLMPILLAVLVILAFFFKFESVALGSKEVALVAMLATISAVLRIPFAAIPALYLLDNLFWICLRSNSWLHGGGDDAANL